MIKAIIFDFFGVLVTEGFKQFRDTYFPDDAVKRRQSIVLFNKHDTALISREQLESSLADLAGIDQKVVTGYLGDNKPNTSLINYIRKELKTRYKIGVLSNSGDDYIRQMLAPEDVKLFDDVVLSYKHGILKPQLEIFEMSAKRLEVKTDECIFVDDSSSHCKGARQAGMKAIFYQDFSQMKADLEEVLSSGANN
jgi:epoxide hydrolase-like predicted phosphatase